MMRSLRWTCGHQWPVMRSLQWTSGQKWLVTPIKRKLKFICTFSLHTTKERWVDVHVRSERKRLGAVLIVQCTGDPVVSREESEVM